MVLTTAGSTHGENSGIGDSEGDSFNLTG